MSATVPLMIFAAGFGTRMGALTRETPKPLIEVGGKTLFARAAGLARSAGMAPVVANTHYLAERMTRAIEAEGVLPSNEPETILDTGGGLKRALTWLDGPVVATMNPDVIFAGANPLSLLAGHGLPASADALLLVVPRTRAHARQGGGDFGLASDGRLSRGGEFVYTGAQLIRASVVADHPGRVFSLNAVWDLIGEERRLFGIVYPGQWCDVGNPEAIPVAEALLRENPDV